MLRVAENRTLEHLIDQAHERNPEFADLRFDTSELFAADEDWWQLRMALLAGVSPSDVAGHFDAWIDDEEQQIRFAIRTDAPRYRVVRDLSDAPASD